MVLYFDECHTLFNDNKPPSKSCYAALCLALTYFTESHSKDQHTIFGLFLSTNNSISRLAPPPDMAFSARAADNMLPPFTELPFDCHPSFPIKQYTITLKQSESTEFLSRFGRPLFAHCI
jgi:hypothetical protein